MIERKNGETNKQFILRLVSYIETLTENNRALRILNSEQSKTNPKTNRTYKEEAEELFRTVALVELFFRENNIENAIGMLRAQLSVLGFNELDIFTNKCIEDGAYNEQKNT